jgi:RND family efflux transporter MFP subunit
MKKVLFLLGVFLLTTTLLSGCAEEEVKEVQIRPIKAIQVGGIEVFTGRWFPGKAKATQEANLAFRVAGTLAAFPVKLGDEVTKNSLLARLDPRDYQVELENTQAQLRKVQASVSLAETEFKRVENIRLQDPGAVSQSMVDTRRGEMISERAQLNSSQSAVTRARDSLGYTTLTAPFKGTVVEKFVDNFEDVQAKQQIVRLVDTRQVEFTVQLPESLMVHANKVKKAFVVFDANPDLEIPATIKEIGKEASQTTRTYPVTLIMDQPQGFKVLSGMAGKARGDREAVAKIARKEQAEAVEIPVVAVFSDQGNSSYVWVIDRTSNKVSRRQVVAGNLTDTGILVKGLQSEEWIATAGVNTLVEGQQVRILE